jgi:voltage-dependent calcium channel
MPHTNSQGSATPTTPPQSIPLRDLTRPPDSADLGDGHLRNSRGRNLLGTGQRPMSGHGDGPRYERLGDASPSPTDRATRRSGGIPPLTMQGQQGRTFDDDLDAPSSPVGNPGDFQAAMGFAGLLVPDISVSHAPRTDTPTFESAEFDGLSPYGDAADEHTSYFSSESDRVPLTDPNSLQPLSGAQPSTPSGQRHDRSTSFHSISFNSPESRYRGSMLGDELPDAETGTSPRGGRSRSHSYGHSLRPDGDVRTRSRSPSNASALSRAGSIVRAMSQRVVNLSGEAELIERMEAEASREASREQSIPSTLGSLSDESETRYQPKHKADPLAAGPQYRENLPTQPVEKAMRFFGGGGAAQEPTWEEEAEKPPNPLRGKSLGMFDAESKIRNGLCDLLVYPLTEPAILVLIILQTILLAVDSSKSVYNHPRPLHWGETWTDFMLLGLFIIFTLEIVARIIVSGFIFNAAEYSTINRKKGLKAVVLDKYHTVFKPQRKSSVRAPRYPSLAANTVLRSFTAIQGEAIRTVEQAQRLQLARRAFLRHGFNRLDFIAVVSFWIAFVVGVTGVEADVHVYVFRMMSCLRILRLLSLTNGTAVSRGGSSSTCLQADILSLRSFFEA